MDSRRVLTGGVAVAAAPGAAGAPGARVWAGPFIGAVEGPGGWLLVAPGTPAGPAAPGLVLSSNCWLRTAPDSAVWFGLWVSDVCSVCEKSTSAVTWALTLSRPTTGSRMSMMRWRYSCSSC